MEQVVCPGKRHLLRYQVSFQILFGHLVAMEANHSPGDWFGSCELSHGQEILLGFGNPLGR